MLLWFAGLSIVVVWVVFRDPAVDHRLVAVGAVLPLVEAPVGPRLLHSVVGSAALLGLVMLATRHRRSLRRHLIAVPIGVFLHLLLDGAWTDAGAFWWPLSGLASPDGDVGAVERGWWGLPLEVAGALALVWVWRRFRLGEADRRAAFLRTGRVGRDLVA